ncbi:MAG: hypothetical protein RDV48_23455 [Candidatus Eremiobacteraeota bacterium]|nr:hypothetical protein [Candidatus Eremiobacteraeota bacterium]
MPIQSIPPVARPVFEKARLSSESSPSFSVQDSVELSQASSSDSCGLIPPRARFAGGPAVRSSLQSPEAPEKKSVTVEINEWLVGEDNTSYIIETAGCGAIKIFVDCGESSYFIIFHSFGTQDSKDAAAQIGDFILGSKKRPESVKILDIQPYAISGDVKDTVAVIHEMLSAQGSIKIDGRTVCLNNIDGEKHSNFVRLDLEGTEREILDRYDHLILKSRTMSDDERAMKIRLFQTLPLSVRTPEFLRKWAPLSLEEARRLVDGLQSRKEKKSPGSLGDKLKSVLAKARKSLHLHSGA